MPGLSEAEEEILSAQLVLQLAQTPYACSSLTRLSGGSTNFVYRGILTQPLSSRERRSSAAETVIIKHSKCFLSVSRDFTLDVTRCVYEESMLHALASFSFSTSTTLVRTPRLYLFIRETDTQVHEDFSNVTDLRAVLLASHSLDNKLSPSFPSPITLGRNIGSWLRGFHAWASAPAQAALRESIGQNEPMRKLKHLVNYGTFIAILQRFPDVLGGNTDDVKVLHDVKDMADRELEKRPTEEEEYWGLIHGDFCMLNVLISNDSKREHHKAAGVDKLFVIDWELAQFGHRAYDLGHMIGDLYEQKHFNNADSAMLCIRGLVEGYGGFNDELAFRTAIHVGTQLIGGYNRRPKRGNIQAPEEMVVDMLKVAKDFVVRGWKKDREWFCSSPLASLFTNE